MANATTKTKGQSYKPKYALDRSPNFKRGIPSLVSPTSTLQPCANGHRRSTQNSSTKSRVDILRAALSNTPSSAFSLAVRSMAGDAIR